MTESLHMALCQVSWPLREPFVIARGTQTSMDGLQLRLTDAEGRVGQAESAGIDYRGEAPASIAQQLEPLRGSLHDGLHPPTCNPGCRLAARVTCWMQRFGI